MRGYELDALNQSLTTLLTLKLHVHTFQCHIPPLHHSLRLVISVGIAAPPLVGGKAEAIFRHTA